MRHHLAIPTWLGFLILVTAPGGCTTTSHMEGARTFPEAVKIYRLSDGKKALAVAADEQGKRAWGVLYGSSRQEHANKNALEDCQRNAARSGVRAECYLFAVGDVQAANTVKACSEGRIGSRRCAVQAKYGW